MAIKRKSFQGVWNIIRFNWHFYVIASLALITYILSEPYLSIPLQIIGFWLSILAALTTLVSLLVSYYVYDLSDLYELNWLPNSNNQPVLNINAGFDETSEIIKAKSPKAGLAICDFYDAHQHTEVSIKRARKAYPPHPDTHQVSTTKLPFSDDSFTYSLAILSAHEIRDEHERVAFFKELKRTTQSNGQIFVTEHLRDFSNFLAYTVGFLHFHSRATWLDTFKEAGLKVKQEIKTTPFITTFILEPNGDTF